MRSILQRYRKWFILTAALVLVVLATTVAGSFTSPAPKLLADAPTETEITFDMEVNRAYTASDGVVVIPASVATDAGVVNANTDSAPSDVQPEVNVAPVVVTEPAVVKDGGNYTLPEDVQLADGSIGLLTIPKLSLSVSVFETADEMEAMSHGVAHFKTTSAWDGNIGLCGHNRNFDLTDGFFLNIHTLKAGDIISYKTALGVRTYAVEIVAEIAETDWSYLGRTGDNRITLITCISGKPRSRLVVQAVAA